jgi:hypothetical protein
MQPSPLVSIWHRVGDFSADFSKYTGPCTKHICIPDKSDADELFALSAIMPEEMIPRQDEDPVLIEDPL